jgi:hypothetical protein
VKVHKQSLIDWDIKNDRGETVATITKRNGLYEVKFRDVVFGGFGEPYVMGNKFAEAKSFAITHAD